jgi:hypothetical protein
VKTIITSFLLLGSLVCLVLIQRSNAHAATPWANPDQTPSEGKGCTAPRSWGKLNGVSDRAIAFEDSEGTIRVLDTGPCMRGETQLIVRIERH